MSFSMLILSILYFSLTPEVSAQEDGAELETFSMKDFDEEGIKVEEEFNEISFVNWPEKISGAMARENEELALDSIRDTNTVMCDSFYAIRYVPRLRGDRYGRLAFTGELIRATGDTLGGVADASLKASMKQLNRLQSHFAPQLANLINRSPNPKGLDEQRYWGLLGCIMGKSERNVLSERQVEALNWNAWRRNSIKPAVPPPSLVAKSGIRDILHEAIRQ